MVQGGSWNGGASLADLEDPGGGILGCLEGWEGVDGLHVGAFEGGEGIMEPSGDKWALVGGGAHSKGVEGGGCGPFVGLDSFEEVGGVRSKDRVEEGVPGLSVLLGGAPDQGPEGGGGLLQEGGGMGDSLGVGVGGGGQGLQFGGPGACQGLGSSDGGRGLDGVGGGSAKTGGFVGEGGGIGEEGIGGLEEDTGAGRGGSGGEGMEEEREGGGQEVLVEGCVTLFPPHSGPGVKDQRGWGVLGGRGGWEGRGGEGGEDDVMVGVNTWVILGAEDEGELLGVTAGEKEIQLGVLGALAHEVMVGVVVEGEGGEGVEEEEVGEEGGTESVGGINVEVTPQADGGMGVIFRELEDGGGKVREGKDELLVLSMGGEVDGKVDGGREVGNGEEDGEEGGGVSGEDGDVGVDGGVP